MAAQIDSKQIRRAAHASIPLCFKSYTLPHEMEEYLEQVLALFLTELGHQDIKDPLAYCMREIAVNAKKANIKRAYFLEKNLDLKNPAEYAKGMKYFKDDTQSNIQYYLKKQKELGLYVKVIFHTQGKSFTVTIKNNSQLTKAEQERIRDKIARSEKFASMEDAFATAMDNTEGAGLGIIILILMLRKIGLDEEAFSVNVAEQETVATLTIPFSKIQVERLDLLSRAIIQEVETLPQFPENIVQLQKMIADPDSELNRIARQISTDPSLTADLLKLVNSAQFMLPRRTNNIMEAVKLVGLKGLRNLLYAHGTQKILGEKYQEMRELWQHSYRTAFYAYTLAKSFRKKREIVDDVYVGGILHDLGQIIMTHLHPDLLERIKKFCRDKEIPSSVLESFSVGLNHAEIGGLMAQKWNFPEALVAAIRYHHEPTLGDQSFKEVVFTVYLANAITDLERDRITFEQIDRTVLGLFDIGSESQINSIQQKLDQAFQDQRDKF